MGTKLKLSGTVLAVLLLAACSGEEAVKDDQTAASSGGAATTGAAALNTINGIEFDKPDSPDSVRTIYFEYDKSDVLPEYMHIVAAHGKLLASDSGRKVELHGHADERGSREYNVALGERRALSVRRLLIGHGASASQITTVSYGEERPAVIGHDESAWSKNRRVEIHYQ